MFPVLILGAHWFSPWLLLSEHSLCDLDASFTLHDCASSDIIMYNIGPIGNLCSVIFGMFRDLLWSCCDLITT